MSRHYLDQTHILINKAILGIARSDAPGILLYCEMAYYLAVYVLFYFYSASNPLFALSLNLRPLFGFQPVQSSVSLFDCGGFGGSAICPLNSSNYASSVLISYLSAFMPSLSITYLLITLTFANFALNKLPGPFGLLKRVKQFS
jgi:hypothetical protein